MILQIGRRCCTTAAIDSRGRPDAVISLNVGGSKVFTTLRSTLAHSPVLLRAVQAAEQNAGLMKGEAVFIDRDADSFEHVLAHLRNTASEVTRPGVMTPWKARSTATVELEPLDWLALRTLFVEAQYYELPALAEEARSAKFRSPMKLLGRAGEYGSPTSIMLSLRSFLLAAGALGITWQVGSQPLDAEEGGAGPSARMLTKVGKALSALAEVFK